MRSRDFSTSALHDVDMAGMPIHMHAGRVGVANPAQLLDAYTASGLQVTAGVGAVGSALVALALRVLNGGASILDGSSSQAGTLDP
jgi:hypothetical protein